nr:zinc finger, CCHC-type [Tanacetum cinerariifolium]
MHFLLTTLKVVYVLSTPSLVWSENETLETTRKRMKWENNDYICRGHILNEDASATKFLVSGFMNYNIVDTRPVREKYHEMLRILRQYTQHNLMIDEAISVAVIVDTAPFLEEFKHGKNQIGSSSVNMVEGDEAKNSNNNKNKRKFKSGNDKFANKKGTVTCWKCEKTGHMKKNCRSRKGNDGAGSNGMMKLLGGLIWVQQVMFERIFVGFKFYVIEPNDYVSVKSIIESRDVIFDEERFTSIPRLRGMIQPSLSKIAKDEVEGCKWILKRKMKMDGSIDKYKARLVIQGFRKKEGIDFFDTYTPVARISTIRLLLALAAIHDLVIHQMDVKTAFLNGDLDEEIYMKQPEGFVMPGHESKVCKLKKSLYGLKQAPKQWHQKFDDVVLSNGFSLNQADKCVYSKFDASGKGVIICLYVDDMLIFGTNQDQVNKTKEFLSSKFDMKDLGAAEVILGIRIKRGNNGIYISQSHYIEKILTKFNFANCSPVYTPVDPTVKRSNRRRIPNIFKPEISTIEEIVLMADRTMEELPQAPTEGYGEAIVIPELAENFEIKTNLLQLVQANKFHGFKRDNPHTHISNFKRMTVTLKYRDVPNDAIKLIRFPYSLEGAARIWYENEPPNSILTWDDLVNKFVNQFFPPSKTTHLKNEISRFTQRFKETFGEVWDRFKKMLRACPHNEFSELTQIDTFYNGLTKQDQDSLNAASGGNILNKTTTEALKIIENKSKVRYSRSKSNVSRVNTNTRDNVSKTDDRIDKLAYQISNLVKIVNKQVIAPA